MKHNIMHCNYLRSLLAVSLLLELGPPRLAAQTESLPASPLPRLTGPSRPASYVAAAGRHALAMGTEQGRFEVWAWPLKLLHDFELRFQTPLYDEPVLGRDVARTVEVTPAEVIISYVHPAFTVRQRVFAAVDEPAVVMLLDVDAVRPIEILAEFQSDLELAWPGSVGGQYVYWDDTEKVFVLSESQRRLNALVGSPSTTSATNQPSHSVPESPSVLRIAVGDGAPVRMPRPGEPAGKPVQLHVTGIPIVIVGAAAPRDSVRAIYHRVLAATGAFRSARIAHAQQVADSSMWVESPDPRFDQAVRWAVQNLDEAFACNPDLGCGLVAGYGPSGARGTRPGFGWYFGGDASINSLGLDAAGQYDLARQALEFFGRYQRADGKIPHEISQAAGRIRWFEDFPYAFYHADTSPFWLMAWGDYWRASGDTAAVRRAWPAIKKAYAWSRGTVDPSTGLMLNSKGGLGAIEVGDLGVGVKSDIYVSAVWIEALDRMAHMAAALKDSRTATEARGLRERALTTLRERFWLEAEGSYAFALLEQDQVRPELTVWPSTAMSFGLFDDARGMRAAAAQARATLLTDWGSRALAGQSALFDPLHYNNGTVWPFVTGFAALGQYRYRNPEMGFAALSSIVRSGFVWGLGRNPEVWSGSVFEPLDTAVPHQFFGTSFILTVLARGLLGWEPDLPAGVVRLAPQLPADWDRLTVHAARAGDARYEIALSSGPGMVGASVTRNSGRGPDTLLYEPALPAGARPGAVTVNGSPAQCDTVSTPRDVQLRCRLPMASPMEIAVHYEDGVRVSVPLPEPARGDRSRGARLLDWRLASDTLMVTLEAPAGGTVPLAVRRNGAVPDTVVVTLPPGGDPVDGYARAEFRISLSTTPRLLP